MADMCGQGPRISCCDETSQRKGVNKEKALSRRENRSGEAASVEDSVRAGDGPKQ